MAPSQKIITRAIILSIIAGLTISIIVTWNVGLDAIFDALSNASPLIIFGYLGVSVLIAIGLTLKWSTILSAYGVRLPFYTLFIYRLIGFAVGYLTPAAHIGGEPVRALLLSKQGIPFKVGFSSALADKIIDMIFNIIFFFIGSLVILNAAIFPQVARITVFILSLIIISLGTAFIVNIFRKKKVFIPILEALGCRRLKKWKKIKRSVNEVELLLEHFYANRRRQFWQAMTINAMLWVLMYFEYKFALLLLGYEAGLFQIFLFLTGVGIAYSIPIPAALGVLELGQISASKLLSVAPSIGVALAFIIRARDIIWTMIGLILLGFFHMNAFKLLERSKEAAQEYEHAALKLELRKLR